MVNKQNTKPMLILSKYCLQISAFYVVNPYYNPTRTQFKQKKLLILHTNLFVEERTNM